MKAEKIKTLFLDIGNVLLTNGWDTDARKRAIKSFKLDPEETESRHKLCFETLELGKMNIDNYLGNVVFYEPREFSKADFITFMLNQSKPIPGAVEYFKELKKRYGLKVIAVSNEALSLNDYRIKTFELDMLFDAFISSCYVGMRKPDAAIYKMACDISHTRPEEALYVDDLGMYIEVALALGIPSFHYKGLKEAKDYFDGLGLTLK